MSDDTHRDVARLRQSDNAEHGATRHGEPDHHGELPIACDELLGPVQGIDEPGAFLGDLRAQGCFVLGQALFGHDTVVGERGREPVDEQGVGPPIGLGDGLPSGLELHFEVAPIHPQDDLCSLPGGGDGNVRFLGQRYGHVCIPTATSWDGKSDIVLSGR